MNIKIIPAIDVVDGKCVRLSQGDYARSRVYSDSPLDVAKRFEDSGADLLHLVDLDGAKSDAPVNLKVLESIASDAGQSFWQGKRSDGATIEGIASNRL